MMDLIMDQIKTIQNSIEGVQLKFQTNTIFTKVVFTQGYNESEITGGDLVNLKIDKENPR